MRWGQSILKYSSLRSQNSRVERVLEIRHKLTAFVTYIRVFGMIYYMLHRKSWTWELDIFFSFHVRDHYMRRCRNDSLNFLGVLRSLSHDINTSCYLDLPINSLSFLLCLLRFHRFGEFLRLCQIFSQLFPNKARLCRWIVMLYYVYITYNFWQELYEKWLMESLLLLILLLLLLLLHFFQGFSVEE